MEIMEVQETWWHRLMAVVLGWCWLIASLIGAYIAWGSSKDIVYSYSWRLPYVASSNESSCSPVLYYEINDSSFLCGQFNDAKSAVDDMVSVGYIAKPEQIPTPRTPISDAQVLVAISKKQPLRSSWERKINWPNLRTNGFYAFLFSAALWLIAAFLQKVVMYVAYGSRHRIIK